LVKDIFYTTFPGNSRFNYHILHDRHNRTVFAPVSARQNWRGEGGYLATEAYTGMVSSFFCAESVVMCR